MLERGEYQQLDCLLVLMVELLKCVIGTAHQLFAQKMSLVNTEIIFARAWVRAWVCMRARNFDISLE